MTKRWLIALAGAWLLAAGAAAAAAVPPNIVFILADDLGWHDLGCYGNPWTDTPNLNRLAAEGMRFTSAYAAAPICSASRASILTGRSPARLHLEFVTKAEDGYQPEPHVLRAPPYTINLAMSEVTIARPLVQAGYVTGLYGKWHVSPHYKHYLGWSPKYGPLQRGFQEGDQDFGSHPYGMSPEQRKTFGNYPPGTFPEDTLTDKAIGFVRRHRNQPFFLYMSHYYVHEPIHTRAKWLADKYRKRLPKGVPESRIEYSAMVETLDHLVGNLLHTLDELGIADHTLVVFMSDNGGNPLYAANGPLRGSKWDLYEAGLRVPLIVRWPGHVQAGSTCPVSVIGTDLYATFCAAAGASLPAGVAMDGQSFLPLVEGRGAQPPAPRSFYWHFPYYHPETDFAKALPHVGINDFALAQNYPQSSWQEDGHVLIHFYEGDRDELYDLKHDPSELYDLSNRLPDLTARLRRELDDKLHAVGARFPSTPPRR